MPSKFVNLPDVKRKDVLAVPPHEIGEIVRGPNLRWQLSPSYIRDLAVLIAAQGQIEPVLFRKDTQGRAVLIAGNNRIEAVKLINAEPSAWLDGRGNPLPGPIPLLARHLEVTEEEALEVTAAENDKLALSVVDRAFSCRNFRALGWDNARIGRVLRMDASRVPQLVVLMELPDRALHLIHEGKATESWGRQLRGLSPEQIEDAMARIDAGESPAKAVRDLRAAHRARGERRPRTRTEIRDEWQRLGEHPDDRVANLAVEIQKYMAGEADAQDLETIVSVFLAEVAA